MVVEERVVVDVQVVMGSEVVVLCVSGGGAEE